MCPAQCPANSKCPANVCEWMIEGGQIINPTAINGLTEEAPLQEGPSSFS